MSQVSDLKNRILGSKSKETTLTYILDMVRNFGGLSEILGREFEVVDVKTGKKVYVIRQKPITAGQLKVLLKEYVKLKKMDAEIERKKWGKKR